jgi:hypothetical protein
MRSTIRVPVVASAGLLAAMLVASWVVHQDHNADVSRPLAASGSPVWITTGPAEPPKAGSRTGPVQPPVTIPNGPLSENLAALTDHLVPGTAVVVDRSDYPALHAATVVYRTDSHDRVTITVQRLHAPITLDSITLGSSADELGLWDNGTQYVVVRRMAPHALQLVVIPVSGVRFTLTVQSADDVGPIADARLSDPATMLTLARQTFDNPTASAIVSAEA